MMTLGYCSMFTALRSVFENSVSPFTFFVQQFSLVTKYSLGTQVQVPICTWSTLGTLALVQATVLLKCSYVEILVHWSGVWCLLASARSHPRRFTAPSPWLPQGENPRSLVIWVTRLWDIWIVRLQDNRDIGLWDIREVELWDIWYVKFGIFEAKLLDVWDICI